MSAGLHRVFDFDVQPSDGLSEPLEEVADLLTAVVFADLVLEVDSGVDDSVERWSETTGVVELLDGLQRELDILLRHRPSSISLRPSFHPELRFSSNSALRQPGGFQGLGCLMVEVDLDPWPWRFDSSQPQANPRGRGGFVYPER